MDAKTGRDARQATRHTQLSPPLRKAMQTRLARSLVPELLDQLDGVSSDLLCANLRDIVRYNRLLGANRLMLQLVKKIVPMPYCGLDVGAGMGDFVHDALLAGDCSWVALDASDDVLRCRDAARLSALEGCRESCSIAASGCSLPFFDAAFDVVTCSQTLHHLEPAKASALLRECARVARRGVVVVDLNRSFITLIGAWMLTRLTSRNRMTRADGVQSARRAYTPDEAIDLARAAGWPITPNTVELHGPTRWSLQLRNVP